MSLFDYDPYETDPAAYDVLPISFAEARGFIAAYHYMKGCANAATGTYGLFDGIHLLGVLAFATPCSEAVRSCVFGPEHRRHVTELHRLVILDAAAPVNTDPAHAANTESWFIARCLRRLKVDKPHLWAVVSFADGGHGHTGTIYQATNALYYGPSQGKQGYLDLDGRQRSARQCRLTLTVADAAARGWTRLPPSPKHRYCFTLPDDRRHARTLQDLLRLDSYTPPERPVTMNRPSGVLPTRKTAP